MSHSSSRSNGLSIPAPTSRPQLVLVGKRGPRFSTACDDCDGFDTVVTGRDGQQSTVRCACQLAVAR